MSVSYFLPQRLSRVFRIEQGQALWVSWKNHPRPTGLAVFFPPTLHNPARNSQGGKEIEYSASPVICITKIMIDYD